jgi:hypothetical protein
VQKVREAADRSRCQNNLKQLTLGLQAFHDAQMEFPRTVAQGGGNRFGWGAFTLPYVEQDALYRALGAPTFLTNSTMPQNADTATVVSTHLCPSDDSVTTNVRHSNNTVTPLYAKSNYVLNSVALTGNKTRMADMKDGTSNTLAIGERDTILSIGAIWAGRGQHTGAGNTAWAVGFPNQPHPKPSATDPWENVGGVDRCVRGSMSSQHPGGVNISLLDGTVRFIRDSIERDGAAINGGTPCPNPNTDFTLQKLFYRNDGRVINMTSF